MKAQISVNIICYARHRLIKFVILSLHHFSDLKTGFLTVHWLSFLSLLFYIMHVIMSLNALTSLWMSSLFSLGSCLFLRVSPTSMRGVMSASSLTNGKRYGTAESRPVPFLTTLHVSCTFNLVTLYLTWTCFNHLLYFFILFF